jgi:hypothetical protein
VIASHRRDRGSFIGYYLLFSLRFDRFVSQFLLASPGNERLDFVPAPITRDHGNVGDCS